MREIIMPKLGLSMETGTIGKWLKKVGERVEAGEIILEVESDKTTIEVEAFHAGTLLKILKEEGAEVPVTEVIGYIGEPGERIPQGDAPQEEAGAAGPAAARQAPGGQEKTRISPAARKLAEGKGIDAVRVAGSCGRMWRRPVPWQQEPRKPHGAVRGSCAGRARERRPQGRDRASRSAGHGR